MGVTVLPYIDQTQTARLQEAASANIQTPKNTDEAVTTFKECLASAERSVQAMAVDALLAASNSGAVSLDTVQQILGFTPQTDAPVDTSPVTDTPAISSSSATNSTTSSGSVSSPENLEEYFKEASETYGVDINLLKSIAKQESNFNPSATSSAGAMGVMQLMPSTAKGLGVTNAYDAQQNIMGGAKLMAQNLKKYNGDVSLALAAYNAGGVVAFLEGIRAFIPASQLSADYVEDTDAWIGKDVRVVVITVDPEKNKLVLSGKVVARQEREDERNHRIAMLVPGSVVEGTVESIMPYGAFINIGNGISGLVHISQISQKRISSVHEVLKEGQKVKAKILNTNDGKVSLSMKALEDIMEKPQEEEEAEAIEYSSNETAGTSLGDLLSRFKL